MAEYFTFDEARAAGTKRYAGRTASVVLKEATASDAAHSFDVFLSHSSKDAPVILGIKAVLEGEGLSVYVDWIDDAQLDRTKVTSDTARTLRRRMGQCKSLVYVATANSPESRWMPWELGFFDGKKGDEKIAILPVVQQQSDRFPGQEYLGLYPVIQKSSYTDGRRDLFAEKSGERWKPLRAFADTSAWRSYNP